MLGGVFRDEMPYRDPHTAGPALWALRHSEGCQFEAATTVFEGTAVERKGLEALAVTLYRLDHNGSPTVNFGRIPSGYQSSSGNNARLVDSGKRFRGGPDPGVIAATESVPVHGALDREVTSPDWMGWQWSPWVPATQSSGAPPVGLYRLRADGASSGLIYVGQGRIVDRIRAHLAKALITDHPQAPHFSATLNLSWVALNAPHVHLLEHENDLIASHVLTAGAPPAAQFIG